MERIWSSSTSNTPVQNKLHLTFCINTNKMTYKKFQFLFWGCIYCWSCLHQTWGTLDLAYICLPMLPRTQTMSHLHHFGPQESFEVWESCSNGSETWAGSVFDCRFAQPGCSSLMHVGAQHQSGRNNRAVSWLELLFGGWDLEQPGWRLEETNGYLRYQQRTLGHSWCSWLFFAASPRHLCSWLRSSCHSGVSSTATPLIPTRTERLLQPFWG